MLHVSDLQSSTSRPGGLPPPAKWRICRDSSSGMPTIGGSGRVEVLWHGRVSESEVEETKAVMGQEM